ncbi:MAG: FHA domain-containing protein [Gammaproteobacteria bacterium]|nr:FHA domain-containing protein [Gammaproteobacteria bacterium]
MDIAQAGLTLSPFHTNGPPVVFVRYQAQQAAEEFLKIALDDERGIGVIHGPPLAGKKTLVYQLLRRMPDHLAFAVVDGARMKTVDLLRSTLAHFGLQASPGSVDDYWRLLKQFLAERNRLGDTPLLVLDNINKMYPSALYALCKMAELETNSRYALRMILVSSKPPHPIINSPSMAAIAGRTVGATELGPMTARESSRYLFAKLFAAGAATPSIILPHDVRNAVHQATGGWPGKIDALLKNAFAHAQSFPLHHADLEPPATVSAEAKPVMAAVREPDEHPDMRRLILTLNGETIEKIRLDDTKFLIGRSELCDLSINSRFISQFHALLVRTTEALHLVDLHSTNGTYVNSRRILSQVLQHEDVISIGNHGIKLKFPLFRKRPDAEQIDLGKTATMRTLGDTDSADRDEQQSSPVGDSERQG